MAVFIRKGHVILTEKGEVHTSAKSINKAKKESRSLQKSGNEVRVLQHVQRHTLSRGRGPMAGVTPAHVKFEKNYERNKPKRMKIADQMPRAAGGD